MKTILRPRLQASLPRREPRAGFGSDGRAETIVLSEEVEVRHPAAPQVAVQPEVTARPAEEDAIYRAGGLYVSRLPSGLVETGSFLICPSDTEYLVDSVRYMDMLPRWDFKILAGGDLEYEGDAPRVRHERVVVLGAQSNRNYYHWLLESVARVLLYLPFDDGAIQYLTPRLYDWQREALHLVGVPPERLLIVKPTGFARFEEVISVSRGLTGIDEPIPGAVSALASLTTPGTQHRRIYIARRHASVRQIANEPEAYELLSGFGFEPVSCESLSVRAQIELFSGAEAVLGVHGAGLANIVFSSPGTQVIELLPEGMDPSAAALYRNLAALREQPVHQIVSRVAPGPDVVRSHRNIEVDVPHLNQYLQRLFAIP